MQPPRRRGGSATTAGDMMTEQDFGPDSDRRRRTHRHYADAVRIPAAAELIYTSGTPGLRPDGTVPEDFSEEVAPSVAQRRRRALPRGRHAGRHHQRAAMARRRSRYQCLCGGPHSGHHPPARVHARGRPRPGMAQHAGRNRSHRDPFDHRITVGRRMTARRSHFWKDLP